MKFRSQQEGHAALLFVLMVPILFGIFNFGIEGARAIQSKTRLEDAAEAASLAVSAHNDSTQARLRDGTASSTNHSIISNYVNHYMAPNDEIEKIEVHKRSCQEISECVSEMRSGGKRFFEHEVGITVKRKSLFPSLLGFGESYHTNGDALVRKKYNSAVDIMLVVDVTGSMNYSMKGGNSSVSKIDELKRVVGNVTSELASYNAITPTASTLGVVTYSLGPLSPILGGGECVVEHIKEKHIGESVPKIWDIKDSSYCSYYDDPNTRSNQLRIPLTTDFNMLNHKLAPIEGYGRTASYNGLIGGAQLLRQGSNQRRLLILLTDGYDSEVKVAREAIVNYDLCRKIKVGLQSPLSVGSQQNTTVKLAIIGFDYVHQAEQGQILDYCVGADNVFNSSSFEEVENQILELIAEEVGTLS